MSQTKPYTIWTFLSELRDIFRDYDPVRDFNDDFPVRTASTTRTDMRTATSAKEDIHEGADGKLYGRKTLTNDSGAPVFVLDSTDVRTSSDVPEEMNKYDDYVFNLFRQQDKYKHFDRDLYARIKRYGFSKCMGDQPMGYKKAAQAPGIKGVDGCGERYVGKYYTAMHVAFNLYLKNAPLPQEAG